VLLVNTTPTAIASLTGQYRFTPSSDYLIDFRATDVEDSFAASTVDSLNGGFYVDLAEARIYDGELNICLISACADFGTEVIRVPFYGAINSGSVFNNLIVGTGSDASGDWHAYNVQVLGNFLGSTSTELGFVLTFSLGGGIGTSYNDALAKRERFVNGAVLFGNPAEVSFVLDDTDIENTNRLGFALFTPATLDQSNQGFFFGGARDTVNNEYITDTTATYTNTFLRVNTPSLFRNGVAATALSNRGGFDVDWGIWRAESGTPSLLFPNAFDDTEQDEVTGDILFATAAPADVSGIANLTGSTFYQATDSLLANNSLVDNNVDTVNGSFVVDLANAYLKNLRIQVCLGGCAEPSEVWLSDIGMNIPVVSGKYVAERSLNGAFTESEGATIAFKGTFAGTFVGDATNGFGFAAGFRWLEDNEDGYSGSLKLLDGAVLFSQSSATPPAPVTSSELSALTRRGLIAFDGNDGKILRGFATDFEQSDDLFIGTAANDLNNPDANDAQVVRLTDTTRQALVTNVGGFDVDWGVWQAGSTEGEELNLAKFLVGVGSQERSLETGTKIVALSLEPALTPYSVSRRFEITQGILESDTEYDEILGSFNLNADQGIINDLVIKACAGGSCIEGGTVWETSPLSGLQITNSLVSAENLSGTKAGSISFAGSLHGAFVGTQGEGFAAGFRFSASDESTLSGAALFEVSELLSASEQASLTRVGFLVFPGDPDDMDFLAGDDEKGVLASASAFDSETPGTPPLFVTNLGEGHNNWDPDITGHSYYVLRRNSAGQPAGKLVELIDEQKGYDLTWGFWESTESSAPQLFKHISDTTADSELTLPMGAWWVTSAPVTTSYVGSRRFEPTQWRFNGANPSLDNFLVSGNLNLDLDGLDRGEGFGRLFLDIFACEGACSTTANVRQHWTVDYQWIDFYTMERTNLDAKVVTDPFGTPGTRSALARFQGFIANDDSTGFISGLSLYDDQEGYYSSPEISGVVMWEQLGDAFDSNYYSDIFTYDTGDEDYEAERLGFLIFSDDFEALGLTNNPLVNGDDFIIAFDDTYSNPPRDEDSFDLDMGFVTPVADLEQFATNVAGFDLTWGLNSDGSGTSAYDRFGKLGTLVDDELDIQDYYHSDYSITNFGDFSHLFDADDLSKAQQVLSPSIWVSAPLAENVPSEGKIWFRTLSDTGAAGIDGLLTVNNIDKTISGYEGRFGIDFDEMYGPYIENLELNLCFNGGGCDDAYLFEFDSYSSYDISSEGVQSPSFNHGDIDDRHFDGDMGGFLIEDSSDRLGFIQGFNVISYYSEDEGDPLTRHYIQGAAVYEQYWPVVTPDEESQFTAYGFTLNPGNSSSDTAGRTLHSSLTSARIVSFDNSSHGNIGLFKGVPESVVETPSSIGTGSSTGVPDVVSGKLNWGYWGGAETHRLYSDFNDSQTSTPSTDKLFALTAIPADISSFSHVLQVKANGSSSQLFKSDNGDSISNLVSSMTIDFGSGSISNGRLSFIRNTSSDPQEWLVKFSGMLQKPELIEGSTAGVLDVGDIVIDSANSTISSISDGIYDEPDGNIEGNVLGAVIDSGNKFAAGFNLYKQGAPATWVAGTALFGSYDPVITPSQESSYTGVGFALKPGASMETVAGWTTHNSSIADTYFVDFDDPTDETDNLTDTTRLSAFGGTPVKVLRSSSSDPAAKSINADGASLVNWGIWDDGESTHKIYTNFNDAIGFSSFTTALAVATAQPADISGLTDNFDVTFNDVFFIGEGSGNKVLSNFDLSMDINFNTLAVTDGSLKFRKDNVILNIIDEQWEVAFSGSLAEHKVNGVTVGLLDVDIDSGSTTDILGGSINTGTIEGDIVGVVIAGGEKIAGGFNLRKVNSTASWAVGAFIAEEDNPEYTLPAPSLESYDISWGAWDAPVENNWVTVSELAGGQVTVGTDDYLATVNPTPIANLQGNASYASSYGSGFIGSGSAGAVSQVVAGMDVDFNSGAISNGNLFVQVGGAQNWAVQFDGSVVGGAVDLNALSGQLSDPSGILSQAIQADLGGVFTGNNAEAFVGGFDLLDQNNALNHVEGLYTIEK
jgi:hypothetical protein